MSKNIKRPGTFWCLAYHSNAKDMRHIENYEIDFSIFNYQSVNQGTLFYGPIPKLFVHKGGGPLADHLANPLHWVVMSERLIKFLLPMIQDCIQLLPAPLYEQSGEPIAGYYIVNVTKVIDCVDFERSPKERSRYGNFIMPTEACINPSRTGGAHMFKFLGPSGNPDFGVTCSYELVSSLDGTGFTGLAAIPYKPYDEIPKHDVQLQ
jgi:hypothetical protein